MVPREGKRVRDIHTVSDIKEQLDDGAQVTFHAISVVTINPVFAPRNCSADISLSLRQELASVHICI